MATSSGNSELQDLVNERKRKRMQSNRESARRSRMRRHKYVGDLMAQVDQIREENNQILRSINITTEKFLHVEAQNSVIIAQSVELSQRLESLDEILNYLNIYNNGIFDNGKIQIGLDCMMMMNNHPWSLMYQPTTMDPHCLLGTISSQ